MSLGGKPVEERVAPEAKFRLIALQEGFMAPLDQTRNGSRYEAMNQCPALFCSRTFGFFFAGRYWTGYTNWVNETSTPPTSTYVFHFFLPFKA